jgi:hypothetical protein
MLSTTAVAFLSPLTYRVHARRRICFVPLGGIYWDDEIPNVRLLLALPSSDRDLIFRLFGIRFRLWAGKELSRDDQSFLDTARSQVPAYALFQRLTLGPDDRRAQEEFEGSAIESFKELFSGADKVEATSEGGVSRFCATFDLTKEPPPPEARPWWKRLWTRS